MTGRATWLGLLLVFPLLPPIRIHVEFLLCRGEDTLGLGPGGRQVGGPLVSAKAGSCLAARTWGEGGP